MIFGESIALKVSGLLRQIALETYSQEKQITSANGLWLLQNKY